LDWILDVALGIQHRRHGLMIRPFRFSKTHHKVGIFSPSSSAITDFPRRFRRSLDALEREGCRWTLARYATGKRSYVSGTAQERADDIHQLLEDEEVGLLIAATGGYNTNGLLGYLDFDLFRKHPKPLVGFSDLTALQIALYTQTGSISFYGPSLLPTFGEFPGPAPEALESLWEAVCSTDAPPRLRPPASYSDEFLFWDKADDRPLRRRPDPGWVTLHGGEGEGRLIGGNLDTLLALAGTPYWPDFDGSLLFWEEGFGSLSRLERQLTSLEQLGVFSRIRAMIVGKMFHMEGFDPSAFYDLVGSFSARYRLPTIAEFSIGHVTPILTLPLGIGARLTTAPAALELLEPAVRLPGTDPTGIPTDRDTYATALPDDSDLLHQR
jgi:muramoyltetrapeptide carboxypeptidase